MTSSRSAARPRDSSRRPARSPRRTKMSRRVITSGAGSSSPLPRLVAAHREHHPEGNLNGAAKADRASVLGALLGRHKLTLEGGNLAQRGSALVHVVRDDDGRRLVIKDGGRRYGGNEHAWLNAHAFHPGVVDVLDQLGGLLLLRWVPGPLAAELPLGAGHYARTAGEQLASLERAPDAATASVSRRITAAERHLPRAAAAVIQHCHERLAAALAARLAADRRQWTYQHGDFHPRNLIVSPERLVAIDPFGLAGPPAWDLAQFAAIAYGGAQRDEPPPHSHGAILTQLVVGFGRTPALLEEMAAYWTILVQRMRQKLGGPPSPWIDSVAHDYARRKPCRRQRSGALSAPRAACCAAA
jgi:streptomycin 6-kinase